MSQEITAVAQAKTDHPPREEGIDAEAELLLAWELIARVQPLLLMRETCYDDVTSFSIKLNWTCT